MDFDALRYSNYMKATFGRDLERRYGDLDDGLGNYRSNYGSNFDFRRKLDASNDGKFSFGEAGKNFFKGLISPVTGMVDMMTSSIGGFLGGSAIIAAGVGIVAIGALPILIAIGAAYGVFQLGKGAINLLGADNGDEAEKAFYNLGAGTSAVGLAAFSAKGALVSAQSKGAVFSSADDIAAMGKLDALKYTMKPDTISAVYQSSKTNLGNHIAAYQSGASTGSTTSSQTSQSSSTASASTDKTTWKPDPGQTHHNSANSVNSSTTGKVDPASPSASNQGSSIATTNNSVSANSSAKAGSENLVWLDKQGNKIGYYNPKTGEHVVVSGNTNATTSVNSASNNTSTTSLRLLEGSANSKTVPPLKNYHAIAEAQAHQAQKYNWDIGKAPLDNGSGKATLGSVMPDELLAGRQVANPSQASQVSMGGRTYVESKGQLFPLHSNGKYNTSAPVLKTMEDGSFIPVEGRFVA